MFLQNILNLHQLIPRYIHFYKTGQNHVGICFIDLKNKFGGAPEIGGIIFMIGEKQVEREEDHLLNFALWTLLLRIAGHHLAILLNIVIDGVVVSYFYFSVDETQHQF